MSTKKQEIHESSHIHEHEHEHGHEDEHEHEHEYEEGFVDAHGQTRSTLRAW